MRPVIILAPYEYYVTGLLGKDGNHVRLGYFFPVPGRRATDHYHRGPFSPERPDTLVKSGFYTLYK